MGNYDKLVPWAKYQASEVSGPGHGGSRFNSVNQLVRVQWYETLTRPELQPCMTGKKENKTKQENVNYIIIQMAKSRDFDKKRRCVLGRRLDCSFELVPDGTSSFF